MKWAFIDYENIGCLSVIDLSGYEKIILFQGSKQPKIDFGDKRYDLPLNLMLIQVKETQANNLDFHLSYYLGKLDVETYKNIAFEIISNDNGFIPLIAHINANGRRCTRVKSKMESIEIPPEVKIKSTSDKSIRATELQKILLGSLKTRPANKRPQKVTTLRNHIASQLQIKGNDVAIQKHFNLLIAGGFLRVSGADINYMK